MDRSLDTTSGIIQRALMDLLGREEDGDVVVFTAVETGDSLLFANDGGRIRLDFPVDGLEAEEAGRAETFFRSMGEEIRVHRLPPSADDEGSEIHAYQMDLGVKLEAAAFLAIDIFLKVFDLSRDFTLVVEEGG